MDTSLFPSVRAYTTHRRQDRLEGALFRIVQQLCRGTASDIVDDCVQEARICLWLARERLSLMEEPTRSRYASACVRNAACRHLRRETQLRTPLTPLEDLTESELFLKVAAWDQTPRDVSEDWLDNLEMPDVAASVSALTRLERDILTLYYAHGMTDREIADATSNTIGSVVKRRSRAIRRLRKSIAQS